MPKRGYRKPRQAATNASDPEGMVAWMKRYLLALRTKNYSPRTIENREVYLEFLIAWLEARGVVRPQEVTKPMLERYQRYLFHYRQPSSGKPLSFRAQHGRLVPVRAYFKWLAQQNVLLSNPASEIELPRLETRLPKHVLTASEAEIVLSQPDTNESLGVRDRALLEVLYSTGLRRSEVIHLSIYDLDTERGTLMVRQGKGKKDRMVPIGQQALVWLERYQRKVRPELSVPPDEGVLFLTSQGECFTPNRLSQLVRDYVKDADLNKTGSCHLFRHTMATLMLEGGADIRYIQEMLGHANVSTTQIYTQVSIRKLQAVHAATHPSAKLERPGVVKAKTSQAQPGEALPLDEELTSALNAEASSDGAG